MPGGSQMPVYRVPVTITGNQQGGPFVNVWHVRVGSGPSLGNVQTQVNKIRTFYTRLTETIADVGPILAPSMTVSADLATDVETQEQLALTWAPITTGTFGKSLPTRLCLAVSWKTSIAARRARGRTFVGPLQTQVTSDFGVPPASVVTKLKAAADQLVSS